MSFATVDALIAALPGQRLAFLKSGPLTTVAGKFYSCLTMAGFPGAGAAAAGAANPGAICTDALAGSLGVITDAAAGKALYLGRFDLGGASQVGNYIVYDRLWHLGALTTALATTTLATFPALTRPDANGVGAELWLEFSVAMGATATTVTINYTNSAGTAGRSTGAISINGAALAQMIPMPLQAGDVGVKSIQSIVVGGTAGAGSFNVVLLRRLASDNVLVAQSGPNTQNFADTGLPLVGNDACLCLMTLAGGTSLSNLMGSLDLAAG